MKRTLLTVSTMLLLAATSASAQTPAAPVRTEASPFSPFVYEVLGATPSLRLRRGPAAEAPRPQATPQDNAVADGQKATATVAAAAKDRAAKAAAPAVDTRR